MASNNIDIGDLIYRLERMRNGANVHIVNSAVYWLRRYRDNGHDEYLQEFAAACYDPVVAGDARQLRQSVNLWFAAGGRNP